MPLHFLTQILYDRGNCLILSVISQINGLPENYSCDDIRRCMAIHFTRNIETFYVSTNTNQCHTF